MTTADDLSGQPARRVKVRIAETALEVQAAQRLRYKVFYEEFGAKPSEAVLRERRDFDEYDSVTDHIIVIDEGIENPEEQIVGTYRLLPKTSLPADFSFYTSQEFDISSLLKSDGNLMELGRSCVLREYRTKPVLALLWQRILSYVSDNNITMLFGCASLQGTDVKAAAEQLAYLYHFHRAPDHMCPTVLPHVGIDMNLMTKEELEPHARRIFSDLPPLIKGYLRVGCGIGNGAYIDRQFNCIDVCIIGQTDKFPSKYVKHYDRANQKQEVTDSGFFTSLQAPITAT